MFNQIFLIIIYEKDMDSYLNVVAKVKIGKMYANDNNGICLVEI